jgi:hypothetical protein
VFHSPEGLQTVSPFSLDPYQLPSMKENETFYAANSSMNPTVAAEEED